MTGTHRLVFRRKRAAAESVYTALGLHEFTAGGSGRGFLDEFGLRHVSFLTSYYRRLPHLLLPTTRSRLMTGVSLDDIGGFTRNPSEGAVLVAAHSGHFDIAAAFIAGRLNRHVAVPVLEFANPFANTYFNLPRRAGGLELLPRDRTTLPDLQQRIRNGQVVVLTLDRHPRIERAASTTVDWFGRSATVRRLAEHLAQTTGCPVYATHIRTVDDGRQQLLTIDAPRTAQRRDPRGRLTQQLANDLSNHLVWAPWEWHIPTDLSELPWPHLASLGERS